MHILSVTNCPLDPRLGSGKTVTSFADGLRRLGHAVDVLAPGDYELWPGLGRAKQLRQGFGATRAVAARMQQRRYDIIEFYGAEFWPAIRRVGRATDRPLLVAHTNGLELLHYERERQYASDRSLKASISRAVHEPLLRQSFSRTDGFVALCEADREYVVAKGLYHPSMTAVVEPGLDEEFRRSIGQPAEHRQPRVCFMGSWLPRKGTGVIVSTMSAVLRKQADAHFDVFGAHEDRDRAAASFPADVRPRVTIHPILTPSELTARLRLARVFLFPSEYEGYGLALAEAMACGLAGVTTPTGLGASLRPGIDAIICGFGSVECLTNAVLALLRDDALRDSLVANAWERVRPLKWESSVARLADVYASWIAGPGRH
jgi:glycosyltransferase involved in cell wall biosynthesis